MAPSYRAAAAIDPVKRAAPLLLLLLVGCVTSPRDRLVWVSLGGSGPCIVQLDERRFTLPPEDGPLEMEARRLAATRRGALIAASAEGLSFGCYRTAMKVIDAAGFRQVGFVSEFVPDE